MFVSIITNYRNLVEDLTLIVYSNHDELSIEETENKILQIEVAFNYPAVSNNDIIDNYNLEIVQIIIVPDHIKL